MSYVSHDVRSCSDSHDTERLWLLRRLVPGLCYYKGNLERHPQVSCALIVYLS